MRRSASEILRNLELRIAKLEKSASVNHLIEDFEVSDLETPKQIKLRLEQHLQDNFDGSFNVALKSINHNKSSLYAEVSQASFEIPIKYTETPLLNLVSKLVNQKFDPQIIGGWDDSDGNLEEISLRDWDKTPILGVQEIKGNQIYLDLSYNIQEKDTTSPSGKQKFEKLKKQIARIGKFAEDKGNHLFAENFYALTGDKVKDAKAIVRMMSSIWKKAEKLIELDED